MGSLASLAAGLGATWAASLEALARGLAAFGGMVGSSFGRGLQPLWQAVCLTDITVEFSLFRSKPSTIVRDCAALQKYGLRQYSAGDIHVSVGKISWETPYTHALRCDGPVVSTTLRGAQNLGRHCGAI